ncbi:MAG TPA: tRNA (guanosine(46)-N7)-methyltransferase TrmB, partial [bacterium]|nr:tRNA (guanosine(46)-N7)-methyltransferase TrmB [bacterium]
TSPRFLGIYRSLLQPGGLVHLKTDDDGLYLYTLLTLQEEGAELLLDLPDLHAASSDPDLTGILTTYERRHLQEGKTIKYICFRLSSAL